MNTAFTDAAYAGAGLALGFAGTSILLLVLLNVIKYLIDETPLYIYKIKEWLK